MGELAVGEVLFTKGKLLLGLSYAYRAEASMQASARQSSVRIKATDDGQ